MCPTIFFTLIVRSSHVTKSGQWDISKISCMGFLGKLFFHYHKEESKSKNGYILPSILPLLLPEIWIWGLEVEQLCFDREKISHRLVRVKHQERSLDPWVPASALEYYFWTCYVWKNTLIWLIYTIWFLLYVFKWKEKIFLKKKINTLLGKKWTKHTKYNFKTTKVKNEKVLKITNNNKKF